MRKEHESEWMVREKKVDGHTLYAVYKLRDRNRDDHEGNRIYLPTGEFLTEVIAQMACDRANTEGL